MVNSFSKSSFVNSTFFPIVSLITMERVYLSMLYNQVFHDIP